jgi:PAS domain S-box-containing protein
MRLTHVLRGEGLSTGTPVLLAWAFAVVAAFLVLGVAAGVVWIRTEGLKAELQRKAERDGRTITDTLIYLVGEVLDGGNAAARRSAGRWHEDHLLTEADRAKLDAMAVTIGKSTPLSKVKLFNRSGSVIYSSAPSELGTSVLKRWAYRAAIEGRPTSIMSRMRVFQAHDGERRDVQIVETYAAFSLTQQGVPDGVIKVYTDITADAEEQRQIIGREARLVAIAMLVLYSALLALLALGTRILTHTVGLAEKQAAKLVEADAAFRDGIDSMADGLVVFDAQNRLVVWNEAYARMVPKLVAHYQPGMPMRDLFVLAADILYGHKGPDAEIWADRRLTMTATPEHPLEFQFADGRRVQIVTRPTSSGGTVATYRDVTREREAQRALAASEQRFRDFADSSADWFWELDSDLRFSYLSAASELVNGTQPEAIYGKRPMDFRPAGVTDAAWKEHVTTLLAHEPYKDFRFETAAGAGKRLTVSVSGKPIFAEDGRFLGYRGIGADITPMVETLQALESTKALAESSARLLHDGIESMIDGYLMLDADERVVLWNTRYVETFPHLRRVLREGMTLRQLLSAHAESPAYAIAPSARSAWIEAAHAQLAKESVAFRRELADGRVLQVQVSRTAGDAAIHIIRDITGDMRAEIAVARSEAMFRDGIESMVDGFVMFDAEDRVVHWNSRYIAIYPYLADRMRAGMSARELMGMHAASDAYGIAPEDRESWVGSTVGHKPGHDHNFVRELADGRVLSVRGTHTAAGGSIYVVTDVTDETIAKRVLERTLDELHASQDVVRRLALVAQHTDNSVIITDAEGRIEWANPGFTRLTGYSLDEVIGRVPGSFLQGAETDAATVARMGAAIRQGESFQVEILNYARDGRPYWLSIDCSPVRNAAGEIERFVAIEVDVTERKLQERRLAEALEREREAAMLQKRFVSIAAHEFRTPLTIIDGAAQRLARYADRTTPADLRERVQKIRGAVARMAQMVDLTLNSARLDEGRLEVSLGTLDLPALVAGICRRIEGISPGFAFNVLCVGDAAPMTADTRLLDQVFTNLISNAVKYSGSSRRVDVTLRYAGEQVAVSVRDFGIGIPKDEQAQLFTRFFRASNARSLPGTGIGLSLVSELVKLHGGEVSVVSDCSSGTIFTVTLPINADRNRVASLAPAA